MYMRFVQRTYKPDYLHDLQQTYDDFIIPKLKQTNGCLCACLVKNEVHQEAISITLWDSQENAEAYEKSGLFAELFAQLKPFLEDSSEWKIQLSEDFQLEYEPVSEEPVVKSFSSLAHIDVKLPIHKEEQKLYLRILSLIIQPGKMADLLTIYTDEILPVLKTTKGCRYAFFTESIENKNEALSVTIWNSQEDAVNYEQSGVFRELLEKVKHTLSTLYQWKMVLEKKSPKPIVTSDDLKIETYSVVTGRTFD